MGQHAVPGRRRVAAAVGSLPNVRQLWLPSHQSTPSAAAARADQGDGLGHAVAALDASDERGADGSGVDPAGGGAVSRAAVATASGSVSKQWGGERRREVA